MVEAHLRSSVRDASIARATRCILPHGEKEIAPLTHGSPATMPTTNITAAVVILVVDEAFEVSWFRRQKACPRSRTARPPHLAGRGDGTARDAYPLFVAGDVMACPPSAAVGDEHGPSASGLGTRSGESQMRRN